MKVWIMIDNESCVNVCGVYDSEEKAMTRYNMLCDEDKWRFHIIVREVQ